MRLDEANTMTERSVKEPPDLYVSIAADVPDEVVSDLVEETKKIAFSAVFERREPEFFAAVEWLIPTAVLLFLGRKFIDTFAEEAAKDAYPAVKAALMRVIRRTSGPGRAIDPIYISSAPYKVPPGPVAALTVVIVSSNGLPVHFRFPADLPEALHANALDGILTVARQLQSLPIETSTDDFRSPHRPLIFTFDSEGAAWKQVDSLTKARADEEPSKRYD